jgi:hypothetical protein
MNWVGYFRKLFGHTTRVLSINAAIGVSCIAGQLAHAQSDPALIQALQQETHDSSTNTTDLESLVWLSTMSKKLERRIPNAFYRVRLLSSVFREATAEGLDPQLVLALIEIESNFDRNALSHAGAQGLMQVMPFWKNEIGTQEDDLYHPLTSLKYGCKILRHYLDRYPNPSDALAAYNGSLGRTVYPDKVLNRLNRSWLYKTDDIASSNNKNLKIAASERRSRATNIRNKLILN